MKRKFGFAWLILTTAALLLSGRSAQAGEWQVSIKSSAVCATTYYQNTNVVNAYDAEWHDRAMPPFIDGLADLNPDKCTSVVATVNETFTVTLTWVDANGAPPPPHLNYLLTGRSYWIGLLLDGAPDMVDGSKCSTDDGLKDPYVGVPLPPNNAEGASRGTHLYRIDNPGATITNTVNMNIDCTWHTASFEFDTNFGNSISVCLLTDLDPFPDEITKTDPVVFYHGTDRDTADNMVAGLALEARGSADFGKGFYTATNVGGTSPRGFSGTGLLLAENTGWRRVRNLQKKKPDGSLDLRWGVVG